MDEHWPVDGRSSKERAAPRGPAGWLTEWPKILRSQLEAERNRWFLWLPVILICGILIYFNLPVEPPVWAVGMLMVVAAGLALAVRKASSWPVIPVLLMLVFTGIGMGKVRTMTAGPGNMVLPSGVVAVEGWLQKIEKRTSGYRILVAPTSIETINSSSMLPKRLQFTWRGALKDPPRPGDHLTLRAKFLPPLEAVWPGGYDPAFGRWFQAIGGAGFLVKPPTLAPTEKSMTTGLAWLAAVERARMAIGARIHQSLPGTQGAIAAALLTGDRSAIPPEVTDHLRRSGLAHLLAISGLHMALFAGGVFWLIRALLALNLRLATDLPIKKMSAVVAIAAATGYLLLSGTGLATQRAYIMIVIMLSAIIFDRPALSMRNVAIAALIILVITPETALSVSFQLSFLTVLGLVAMFEYLETRAIRRPIQGAANGFYLSSLLAAGRYFWRVSLTTLVAGIATAPIAAYHFNRVAVYSLLGNLLAIPVIGTIVMPAAIAGLIVMPFGLESWPLAVMGHAIGYVTIVAETVSGLPGASRLVSAMPVASGLLLALGLIWIGLWRGTWRLFGLVIAAIGALIAPLKERPVILIAASGNQVGVIARSGELVFSSSRAGKYAAERWLLKLADPATFDLASKRKGFSCDLYGCTVQIAGGTEVALVRHPSILAEECARAAVIITRFDFTGDCQSATNVITPKLLREKGAHALFLSSTAASSNIDGGANATFRIETSRRHRGDRPWTVQPKRYWKKEFRHREPLNKPAPKSPDKLPNAPSEKSPPLQVRI